MFDRWMRILNRVPYSLLWLFNGGETTKNLEQVARGRGIDPFRLVFADKLPKAEHLARLRLAVRLTIHPAELRKMKDKLSRNRLKEPLFDTPRFVRNLEVAYSEMWRIFPEGRVAKQIEVFEV